jgi:glycosyltransferase involved in cell wall biosynthesis
MSRSRAEAPRVAFLVADLGRSGGMAVVRRYARHLAEGEGMQCKLVVCAAKHDRLPDTADGIPVTTLAAIRGERVDVAIATWWTTAESLFELDALRRIVFLQSLEHRFYREHENADRVGALSVLDLPVEFIAIGSHMSRLLDRHRPDARCHLVPVGIDKDVFTAHARGPSGSGPLRVLVEGQPTLWFKGVPAAVAAVRDMSAPARLTLAVHELDDAEDAGLDVDRVVGGLAPEGMAALYGDHDVLLKLSRFEGLALPPLEAMHVGVPSVLTPFTGSDDYARHGENAIVVGFDDHPGTVAALDLLARNLSVRDRLSRGALATAADWPDVRASSQAFCRAVRTALDEPALDGGLMLRRFARGRRLAIELAREHSRRDAVRLDHARLEAEHYRVKFEEHLEIAEQHRLLAEGRLDTLHELTSRPSYRAAHFAKRLVGRQDKW